MKNQKERELTLDEMLEIAKMREDENERIYLERLEKYKENTNK